MNKSEKGSPQLIKSIFLENFLSFGPEMQTIDLGSLNLLIGPNASGKSNLIEAIALMRSTPISSASHNMDLRGVIRKGGGVGAWIWKGEKQVATVFITLFNSGESLTHYLSFQDDLGFEIVM